MNDWQPIETAPRDKRVIAWNAVTGEYITQYREDGQWPMNGWGSMTGTWYPRPTLWHPLPSPSEESTSERG